MKVEKCDARSRTYSINSIGKISVDLIVWRNGREVKLLLKVTTWARDNVIRVSSTSQHG